MNDKEHEGNLLLALWPLNVWSCLLLDLTFSIGIAQPAEVSSKSEESCFNMQAITYFENVCSTLVLQNFFPDNVI